MLVVTDRLGLNVLVAAGHLLNRVRMETTLVGERCGPYIGRTNVVLAIGKFVDKHRQVPEATELGHHFIPELQLEIRDHAGQIAVPSPFTVSVDRALHLSRARPDCGQRVRHTELAIIMGVNPDRR